MIGIEIVIAVLLFVIAVRQVMLTSQLDSLREEVRDLSRHVRQTSEDMCTNIEEQIETSVADQSTHICNFLTQAMAPKKRGPKAKSMRPEPESEAEIITEIP